MTRLRFLLVPALGMCLSMPAAAQDKTPVAPADLAEIKACLTENADDPQSCSGQQSDRCMSTPVGSSTIGMDDCIMNEEAVWDRLLNERYNEAVAAAKEMDRDLADRFEPDVFTSLLKAQRAWIAYRDAECHRIFASWKAGTMRTTSFVSCMLKLTSNRAIALAPNKN